MGRATNTFARMHNITSLFIVVKTERSITATTTRLGPKAARNRRRQVFANIGSGGLLPRKHSPDGARILSVLKSVVYR